jgi:hypothetical protein
LVLDWGGASAPARYAQLRALGFRYIVVNANPAYTSRTPTGVEWTVLGADSRTFLHQVFQKNGVIVYSIGNARRSIAPAKQS